MSDRRIAFVTPSFARDFALCAELNESILRFAPPESKHYVIVDACDLRLFRSIAGSRTVVAAIEDVIPRGHTRVPMLRKWWFSAPAMVPAKGWLVQQFVKLSMPRLTDEPLLVNVDSDVRFVRTFERSLFVRGGRTRLYRLPGGVTAGMHHVKWHRNVCRLLGVPPDTVPMDDYVGNVISWDRALVLATLARIESVSGVPWYVAYARSRLVSEYLSYGLYVDKVIGVDAAPVWIDERPWCHTYWGPGPLAGSEVDRFTRSMREDDIAFSIAGYTGTPPEVTRAATRLALRVAGGR